jgi:hypothetical protein
MKGMVQEAAREMFSSRKGNVNFEELSNER